jgi:hypothetical protein
LDTVWQRLYLFSIISLARKMASERMDSPVLIRRIRSLCL